jgi:hypothetical protein
MTESPHRIIPTMTNVRRLARASLDLFVLAAPIAAGLLAVAAVLTFWPGAMLGLSALLLLAWGFAKMATRTSREHHY